MRVLDGRDAGSVQRAALEIARGGLVAFPTETVYGLGARADDNMAVGAIFSAKGRPQDHPLIVHVMDVAAARAFAALWPIAAQALAARFWPGPVTVIVPRRPGVAEAASGGHPTIGLRCPDHPVARALLQQAASRGVAGIAGPSANRFGRVSPTCAAHVRQEFGDALMVLDGGPCTVGIESAVVDCTRDVAALLRPGSVQAPQLAEVLQAAGAGPLGLPGPDAAAAPGTLASHYAPSARVRLLNAELLAQAPRPSYPVGVYSRHLPSSLAGLAHHAMSADPQQTARELFAVLRDFDERGVHEIWVEQVPPEPQWEGIRDRLRRAAQD